MLRPPVWPRPEDWGFWPGWGPSHMGSGPNLSAQFQQHVLSWRHIIKLYNLFLNYWHFSTHSLLYTGNANLCIKYLHHFSSWDTAYAFREWMTGLHQQCFLENTAICDFVSLSFFNININHSLSFLWTLFLILPKGNQMLELAISRNTQNINKLYFP